jgi:hypothetical protein
MLDAARCKDVSCIRWSIGKRILQQVVDALTNGFDVLGVATFQDGIGFDNLLVGRLPRILVNHMAPILNAKDI